MKSFLSRRHRLALVPTLFLSLAGAAHGAAITVPTGLNPGDTYRIIFVTSTTTNATSSSIHDYNQFVTNVANQDPGLAGLSTMWRALAATATVSVFAHTGLSNLDTTTRFFNTAGQLVATGVLVANTGLYGGPNLHTNAITDETGAGGTRSVWTGVTESGSTYLPLGDASGDSSFGQSSATNYQWTGFGSGDNSFNSFSLYAVSGVLTVPSVGAPPVATPEPSTIALLGGALVALGMAKRRRAGQ